MSILPPISSPCIDICDIAPNGLCAGCGRTLDEIAGWGMWAEAERRRVMADLPARIKALGPKAAAPEDALAKIRSVLKG